LCIAKSICECEKLKNKIFEKNVNKVLLSTIKKADIQRIYFICNSLREKIASQYVKDLMDKELINIVIEFCIKPYGYKSARKKIRDIFYDALEQKEFGIVKFLCLLLTDNIVCYEPLFDSNVFLKIIKINNNDEIVRLVLKTFKDSFDEKQLQNDSLIIRPLLSKVMEQKENDIGQLLLEFIRDKISKQNVTAFLLKSISKADLQTTQLIITRFKNKIDSSCLGKTRIVFDKQIKEKEYFKIIKIITENLENDLIVAAMYKRILLAAKKCQFKLIESYILNKASERLRVLKNRYKSFTRKQKEGKYGIDLQIKITHYEKFMRK